MNTKHGKNESTLDDLIAEELARQLTAHEGTRVWFGGYEVISPNEQKDDN